MYCDFFYDGICCHFVSLLSLMFISFKCDVYMYLLMFRFFYTLVGVVMFMFCCVLLASLTSSSSVLEGYIFLKSLFKDYFCLFF